MTTALTAAHTWKERKMIEKIGLTLVTIGAFCLFNGFLVLLLDIAIRSGR